jgi:hypothetical protein
LPQLPATSFFIGKGIEFGYDRVHSAEVTAAASEMIVELCTTILLSQIYQGIWIPDFGVQMIEDGVEA